MDAEHHFIIVHEVTNIGKDRTQLWAMRQKARDQLACEELTALADGGHYNGKEVLGCKGTGVLPCVPRIQNSGDTKRGLFIGQDFASDAGHDHYTYPVLALMKALAARCPWPAGASSRCTCTMAVATGNSTSGFSHCPADSDDTLSFTKVCLRRESRPKRYLRFVPIALTELALSLAEAAMRPCLMKFGALRPACGRRRSKGAVSSLQFGSETGVRRQAASPDGPARARSSFGLARAQPPL